MNVISSLWNGRAGLAKTYWLWGVLSGIPWGLALSLVTPGSNLAIIGVLGLVAYYVIVNVGIWRAASKYQGTKAWAILAKVAVATTPVCLVIGTLAAIIIPATHQPASQEQPTTPDPVKNNKETKYLTEEEMGFTKETRYLTEEEMGFTKETRYLTEEEMGFSEKR